MFPLLLIPQNCGKIVRKTSRFTRSFSLGTNAFFLFFETKSLITHCMVFCGPWYFIDGCSISQCLWSQNFRNISGLHRKLFKFRKAFVTNIFSFVSFQQIDIFLNFCVIFKYLDRDGIGFHKSCKNTYFGLNLDDEKNSTEFWSRKLKRL
jgi:hypothetical protein